MAKALKQAPAAASAARQMATAAGKQPAAFDMTWLYGSHFNPVEVSRGTCTVTRHLRASAEQLLARSQTFPLAVMHNVILCSSRAAACAARPLGHHDNRQDCELPSHQLSTNTRLFLTRLQLIPLGTMMCYCGIVMGIVFKHTMMDNEQGSYYDRKTVTDIDAQLENDSHYKRSIIWETVRVCGHSV